MEASRPCAYGKLPIHGDFVRLHGGAPELGAFDRWLQAGLPRCAQRLGRGYDAAFDALPTTRFLFWPGNGAGTLAGVLVPSRDRANRRYPFVLAQRLGALTGEAFDLLPFAIAPFLGAAEAFARDGWRELDLAGVQAQIERMTWNADFDAAAIEARGQFQVGPPAQLFAGQPELVSDERRAIVLADLVTVLRQPWPPRFLLTLPTHATTHDVGFWCAFVRRFVPRGAHPTLVAWTVPDGERRGRLRLLFDAPSERYLEPVLWPERDQDAAYDLAHGRGTPAARVREAVAAFDPILSARTQQEMLQMLARAK